MKNADIKITERQRETYQFILNYILQHGFSPSVREVAQGIYVSKPIARRHIEALIKHGLISVVPRTARSITIQKII